MHFLQGIGMLVVKAREKIAKCLKISKLKCGLLYHEGINWDMFTEPFLLPTLCLQM